MGLARFAALEAGIHFAQAKYDNICHKVLTWRESRSASGALVIVPRRKADHVRIPREHEGCSISSVIATGECRLQHECGIVLQHRV
jgi:hypothetical protein